MLKDNRIFIVPADWQLRDKGFYITHIWRPAASKNIARVPWLDALTLIYRFDGQVFLQSGRPFHIPEIDDVFVDPENRWMSHFLEADESGLRPKRICRVLPKLRLIALYNDITKDRTDT